MRELKRELEDFLEKTRGEIIRAAAEAAAGRLPRITEELFGLFERTGNRLRFEAVYFARRKALAALGLKALLERQEEGQAQPDTLARLSEVMEDICGEECWALPAHVKRAERDDWRVTVDLFAAETGQTLSDLADTLGGELDAGLGEKVRENVERRLLRPFFESEIPYEPWEHVRTNWNAVCAGCVGSACLHLLRGEPERLEACIDRICKALPYYMEGFAEDGACVEGLSYFTYGMTYFVNFALELKEYTRGERDLLCGAWNGFAAGGEDKRALMARFQQKCYFPDGRTISFSDGDSRDKFRVGLSCALARLFAGVKLPNMERAAGLHDDTCYRFAALKMDLLETRRLLDLLERGESAGTAPDGGEEERGLCHIFPSAQWFVARSADGAGMACKGGDNDEPHNHNDIGHFIYEAAGEFFLTDLGAGEYTKEYFSEGRYGIFCNHSGSHSVPVVRGRGQRAGKQYRCCAFEASQDGRVRLELAGAYGDSGVESLSRQFTFSTENGLLTVCDTLRMAGGPSEEERAAQDGKQAAADQAAGDQATGVQAAGDQAAGDQPAGVQAAGKQAALVQPAPLLRENLVTQIRPQVEADRIILQGKREKCIIEIVEGLAGEISVREHEHSNHKGLPEKVYTLEWEAPEVGGKAVCRFMVCREGG